jgi:hypothetical protein
MEISVVSFDVILARNLGTVTATACTVDGVCLVNRATVPGLVIVSLLLLFVEE